MVNTVPFLLYRTIKTFLLATFPFPIFDSLLHVSRFASLSIPSNTSLMFFLLIYNHDSNSRNHVSIGTLTACLSAYSHFFKSYSTSNNYGANFDVFILGDFKLSGIMGKQMPEKRDSKELSYIWSVTLG